MTPYQFLKDYFSSEENFFIFTLDRNTSKIYQRTFTTQHSDLEKYLKKCLYFNSIGSDIYYSLNTFKKVDNKLRRRQANINSIKSFYFDIDTDMEIIYPKIIKLLGVPTYDINTSPNKKQLIYKFDNAYQGDYKYFSQLLEGLTKYFKTDKTFDTPRIFKMIGAGLQNNKNGYKINFTKNENYFTFEDFEVLAKPFLNLIEIKPIKKPKPTKNQVKNPPKTKKSTSTHTNLYDYKKYENNFKINKKYNQLLTKYQNDYSHADIAFVKWLRTSKQINDNEILVEKLFSARGYDSLMKHDYQIDYYIVNILEKTLSS
ncbi:MAG: hypothetical protein U9N59_15465 [Campylobacterota bacterium]|nr:hypothetical protein [Campylobacterota bacterium]